MRVLERTHLFRIGAVVAALLSVSIALMVVRASAAHADGYTYVAVGDSYSSGEGGGAYYDGACDQSPFSYPSEFMQRVHAARCRLLRVRMDSGLLRRHIR
jgi:hypothetical protein